MKDQLEYILKHYSLSSAQFADSIGVQRSSISHIISGRNKPSFDFIQKILVKYPDIDADWLLTGKGNALKSQINPSEYDGSFAETPLNNLFSQNADKESNSNHLEQVSPTKNVHSIVENVVNTSKITNVNKVKSIVLIYEDNSFEILSGR